jgi:hypothetical protein
MVTDERIIEIGECRLAMKTSVLNNSWLLCLVFCPCSDRAGLAKALRKSDKKVREVSLQFEEERRHADQYKEQVY